MKKILLAAWILACIGEFLVPLILGRKVQGYSHLKTVMSAIATRKNGTVAMIYSAWLVIFGTGITIIIVQIWNLYHIKNYKIALAIWILYGVGTVICGIFPVDETKKMVTLSAKIHGFTAVITFFLIIFIPLFFKKILLENGLNTMAAASNIVTIVSFIVFVLQIISEREQFANTFLGNTGLWQRTYLFIQYIYMFVVMYGIIPSTF